MDIYLVLVIILFAFAISDLMVGVSNDAVNFLNSAIGAKVASFRTIILIASLGVIIGATFSSGLMEIARKGLFFPAQFTFKEVMFIFVAVVATDVILLDLFNTFGLPTSTTVSIVFELLGASVALALVKIMSTSSQTIEDIGTYINSAKALAIITGILVSVVIAFTVGTIIQWVTRLLFTFNLRYNLKYYSAIWGGFSVTGILYFMVIKGAKGSSFVTTEMLSLIEANTMSILFISFIAWTILFQILLWLFRVNVLNITVLVGTFALAMAFAGNDLVNFIGVPLAGLNAYKIFIANPGVDPDSFMMGALANDVKTETWILLMSGIVMAITLWTSKKARSVIETSIDLSRQNEGNERFNSSILSRNIVRGTRKIAGTVSSIIPFKTKISIEKRFSPPDAITLKETPEGAAFDSLRASVNLVVASVLIAMGTSLKLPLSTTYVTFMVAMGSSLADRAWGRESAVYRITGVLSVIGGWFFTAFAAFSIAFLIALGIAFGKFITIMLLIPSVILLMYRSHKIHLKREKNKKANDIIMPSEPLNTEGIYFIGTKNIVKILENTISIINKTIVGLVDEDRKLLRESKDETIELNATTKALKNNISSTLEQLNEEAIDTGHFYVQAIDYLREISNCVLFINQPTFTHIENNHKPLINIQVEELSKINAEISLFYSEVLCILKNSTYNKIDLLINRQSSILNLLEDVRKRQVKRIKLKEIGTRNTILYLNMLAEFKNLLLFTISLVKSNRDFDNSFKSATKQTEQFVE